MNKIKEALEERKSLRAKVLKDINTVWRPVINLLYENDFIIKNDEFTIMKYNSDDYYFDLIVDGKVLPERLDQIGETMSFDENYYTDIEYMDVEELNELRKNTEKYFLQIFEEINKSNISLKETMNITVPETTKEV